MLHLLNITFVPNRRLTHMENDLSCVFIYNRYWVFTPSTNTIWNVKQILKTNDTNLRSNALAAVSAHSLIEAKTSTRVFNEYVISSTIQLITIMQSNFVCLIIDRKIVCSLVLAFAILSKYKIYVLAKMPSLYSLHVELWQQ